MLVATAAVVGANDGEAGILALSPRVGLKRATGKTSKLRQVVREFLAARTREWRRKA